VYSNQQIVDQPIFGAHKGIAKADAAQDAPGEILRRQ
jgi:hypothetical protein